MPVVTQHKLRKSDQHPRGASWVVPDDDVLARSLAQLALGQWEHLAEILRSSVWIEPPVDYAAEGAIATLTAPPGDPNWQTYHRDGWIFQAISWIAAVESDGGPTKPPHISHAEKGFDGMQLQLTSDGKRVKRLLIFEDKATTSPRATVRNDVWPSVAEMETGQRDQQLRSELSSLLLQAPHIDKRDAVDRVINQRTNRAYRIAITAGATHQSASGIRRLFKGFEEVAPGRRSRRHGHVLHREDLRPWLAALASDAAAHVRRMSSV